MTEVAAVVLAAGRGKRLRPLTDIRPKPLCPVANVPLVDLAIDEVVAVLGPLGPERLAVNAHHLADRAHVEVEQPVALGTAGALGNLRPWLAGRAVLVRNGDAWRRTSAPASFVADWDGVRPRLLVVDDRERPDFAGRWRYAGLALLAWADVARLPVEPAGLYETVWAAAERAGRLDLMTSDADFVDCGTPADYLRANLAANGGESVIGPEARVDGEVIRSVVWPGGVVRKGERLVDAIRVGADLTVDARPAT